MTTKPMEEKQLAKKVQQYYRVSKDTIMEEVCFKVNSSSFENEKVFEEAKESNPVLEYFYWDWSLHQAYKKKEVVPYYKWLQRLEQFFEWETKNHYKYNSFLQTFYTNDSTLVPFLLIPITVFLECIGKDLKYYKRELDELNSTLSENESAAIQGTKIKNIKHQINLIEQIMDEVRKLGKTATFLILDGNNRCRNAFQQFFSGKPLNPVYNSDNTLRDIKTLLMTETSEDGKIDLDIERANNGTPMWRSLFPVIDGKPTSWTYTKDLDLTKRAMFDNAWVLIKVILGGTLKTISNLVISYNEGTSWTDFEKLCISGTYMAFGINACCDGKKEGIAITNLAKVTEGLSGAYEIQKKGDLRTFAECIGYLHNPSFPQGVEQIYSSDREEEKVKLIPKVSKMLTLVSTLYKCQPHLLAYESAYAKWENYTTEERRKLKIKEPKAKDRFVFSGTQGKEMVYRNQFAFMSMLMDVNHIAVKEYCQVWGTEYTDSLDLNGITLELLDEFAKWHYSKTNSRVDGKINPDYTKKVTGQTRKISYEATPGSYASSRKGMSKVNWSIRHEAIAKFIDANIKKWLDKGVITYKGDVYKPQVATEEYLKKELGFDPNTSDHGHRKPRSKRRTYSELEDERNDLLQGTYPEQRSFNRSTKDLVEK